MKLNCFKESFVKSFWQEDDYAFENHVDAFPDDAIVCSIEEELGYSLPLSYVELMRVQNGGYPVNTHFVLPDSPETEQHHLCLDSFFGIGRIKPYSLCGEMGQKLIFDEWGYPNDGVYIGRFLGGYHNLLLLDHSSCGKDGEPVVVMVDGENEYKKTFLAVNFEAFVKALMNESVFDRSEEELAIALGAIRDGSFAKILQTYFKLSPALDFEKIMRNLLEQLSLEKGSFNLHEDELSYKVYDLLFYLTSKAKSGVSRAEYLELFPELLVMADADIHTGGYAPGFIEDWWYSREQLKVIASVEDDRFEMNSQFANELLVELAKSLNQ